MIGISGSTQTTRNTVRTFFIPLLPLQKQFLISFQGPIVRYGANSISIASPNSLPAIHGPKANVKKGSWYKTLDISAGAPSVQMEIDKQQHALRRRFLAPAFSEKALKEAEKLITISAKKLLNFFPGVEFLENQFDRDDGLTHHDFGIGFDQPSSTY